MRQELKDELGVEATLPTAERAVTPFRQCLEAERCATVRFETPPGQQMQIDPGEARVTLGGVKARVHLFVATLGYSRRGFVHAFLSFAEPKQLVIDELGYLTFVSDAAHLFFQLVLRL